MARDRETIDAELRRLAALRRSTGEHGGEPWRRQLDQLLDERLGHLTEEPGTEAGKGARRRWSPGSKHDEARDFAASPRRSVLGRFAPLMVLPLSLIGVAAVLMLMFAVHNQRPAAQPTVVPPSPEPTVIPPSAAPSKPAAPTVPGPPPLDIVDRAFVDALKHEGVPVPSQEYVANQGHAVCDFLAHRPNLADAVNFVQRSSIWDADQSADFAAGAVVSYCPQYEPTSSDEMPPAFQNALTVLQAIQGDLQAIRGDLQDISGPH
jgi:predicted secreted protein